MQNFSGWEYLDWLDTQDLNQYEENEYELQILLCYEVQDSIDFEQMIYLSGKNAFF